MQKYKSLIGTMKGSRWGHVKTGYKKILMELNKMKEVIVSTFSFDDKISMQVKEKKAGQVYRDIDKLLITSGGTDYKCAIETIITLIEGASSRFKDYLHCILFLSDGEGGYSEESVLKLKKVKDSGVKIGIYTISCVNEEEKDMMKMSEILGGEHFKIGEAEASKQVFIRIILKGE